MHYIFSFFFPLPFLLFLFLFITLRRNAGNEFNCLDEWKLVQRRQTHVECKQISNSSIQEAIKHNAELDDTRYVITTSRDLNIDRPKESRVSAHSIEDSKNLLFKTIDDALPLQALELCRARSLRVTTTLDTRSRRALVIVVRRGAINNGVVAAVIDERVPLANHRTPRAHLKWCIYLAEYLSTVVQQAPDTVAEIERGRK